MDGLFIIKARVFLKFRKNILKIHLHGKFHIFRNRNRLPPIRLNEGKVKTKTRSGDNARHVDIKTGFGK